MMLSRQNKFLLAIGLQLLVLCAIMLFKVSVLKGGDEVMLKIRPMDPRDILRGDYVTFQYDINEVRLSDFNYAPVRNGDTVFVPLVRNGAYWSVACCVSKAKPPSSQIIFLKGAVASGGEQGANNGTDAFRRPLPSRNIQVVYGMEDYFIPEGAGQGGQRFNNASAKVMVDENGRTVLKQIYVDGHPWP